MSKALALEKNFIIFKYNGNEAVRLSVNELFGFSDSQPWETNYIKISEAYAKDEKIIIAGLSACGRIRVSAEIIKSGDYYLLQASYKNISNTLIQNAVMQAGFLLHNIHNENITIPHNLYNDNPTADKSRLIAHIGPETGGGLIVEEHRLPIPAVNIEWENNNKISFFSILSVPVTENCEDADYWSLGAIKTSDGAGIQMLSGQTMFNGIKDMVYAGKNAPVPFERGYKLMLPGQEFTKTYYFDFGYGIKKGRGFRNIVRMGFDILHPVNIPAFSINDVVSMKSNCLDSRYNSDGIASGYLTFGSANSFGNVSKRPDYYLYGWTGQAIKLAWCDTVLGMKNNDEERIEKALRTLDFYASYGESEKTEGLRFGYYLVDEKKWMGGGWDDDAHFSSRIQGEAIYDLLDVMLLLRESGRKVPDHWESAAERACKFIMDTKCQTNRGLYPLLWDTEGIPIAHDINSAGISCVIALAKAYEYFGNQAYLDYAAQKLQLYYDFQMDTFAYPFSKATMDARCEDKEAGMFFFIAAVELYKITKNDLYQEWAEVAGDWILTFVYFWETGFKEGSYYREKGFKTTGWPGVSVQNHHLDVFFPCYEMYEFGKLSGNEFYEYMGRLVFNAFSHGICSKKGEWGFDVIGEQTEQFYQTNFFMSTYPQLLQWVDKWRFGLRIWNPSWIIAQVLTSGLKFMG